MNLSDARGELAGRGFDYLSATRMNIALNRARNDLEDLWTWPWLHVQTAGIVPLTITDLKYVLLVKDDSSNELLGMDLRQVAQNGTDLTMGGTPLWWYLTDQPATTLNVWPVSDATVTVDYIRESPELLADTDTPLIPVRYHPLWVDLAVVSAYRDSDNFPAAQTLQADVTGRLQLLIERYETRNRQNPRYITLRYGGEDE